jgi:hypothetical protein
MLRLVPIIHENPALGTIHGSGSHYLIRSGRVTIGNLHQVNGGPQNGNWSRSITCLHSADEAVPPRSGMNYSREMAMADIHKAWTAWLDRAGAKLIL